MVLKFCFKNTIEFRNKKVNIFSQNLPVETSLLWRLKGKAFVRKKEAKVETSLLWRLKGKAFVRKKEAKVETSLLWRLKGKTMSSEKTSQ